MKPHALITGGAGLFGSHLCDALLCEGYSLVAVDNLLTGGGSSIEHCGEKAISSFFSSLSTAALIAER
jgi:dTDP-glucose 4,6-dehydratase